MAEHETLSEGRRCGADIEVEWPGHRVVLSRRTCKNRPKKGYDHCRHHLTLDEWERLRSSQLRGRTDA